VKPIQNQGTMIHSIYYPPNNEKPQRDIPLNEIPAAMKQPDGLLWLSLENTGNGELTHVLGDIFKFHPLAIEDCQSDGYQTPKVDDFQDYIYIVAQALAPQNGFENLETIEFNLFLGSNFLVTSYKGELMPPVQDVWKLLEKDNRLHNFGSDFLSHALLDHLVDDYMPLLDNMEDEIEALEELVLEKPKPETMERILALKHSIMWLRRVIAPQREVMNRLSRDEYPMIDRQSKVYFRDIYDHLVRIQDMAESIRDIVGGSLDIYLNSTSLRLNEIMKALTIVSTIFLPLSFVAGVYGMNFQYLPEIYWRYGYIFVWCVFIAIAVGMLAYFKKRNWF